MPAGAGRSTTRRLALLLASVALGATIGVIGQSLTQQGAWFLAIPACLAIGWLVVADPTRCSPHDDARPPDRREKAD